MNGLVLLGGNSSRMGTDKALIKYHGVKQYRYLYELILPYCERVFLSARENKYDLPTILDIPDNKDMGPISGLVSAYEYEETDWLVIAIDYPLFGDNEVKQLVESNSSFCSVFYNSETSFYEPYLGIYRKEFMPILKQNIDKNQTSLQRILQSIEVCQIIPANFDIIKSINERD